MAVQINAATRLMAATALTDADAKKIFKAFLAEDVSPKEVSKITYKMGPKKLILRLNGTEGVASDKELKRYNPAWTSALLKEYLDSKGAKKVTAATYTRVADIKVNEIKTADECFDLIDKIRGDYRNVVGGMKAWYSGRNTELTPSAKKKIDALEKRIDVLSPDDDD